jgi:two-component system, OmpR family, sensor histidine kinase KdpD
MARGSLRIYLGAAPGVGKTYAMLGELRRRAERGADVVVGIVETHGRARTADQLVGLEVLPRRNVEYRGTTLSELDVDAVITRQPDVVAIDEYAHTNAPGSPNAKRWEDVEQILDAGIDVITTVNVQHLESLNDVVAEIAGVQQQETVPDRMVRAADQIELVDMSPEALRRRMAHGNIYPPERASAALANFFRPGNLGALRELALLWVADRVEEHLADYLAHHGVADQWETRERVVVGIAGGPGADTVIRRASRIASRVGGELIGVHVGRSDGRVAGDRSGIDEQQALVEALGGENREVVGEDPVATLVDVARSEHATQIVIGATREPRWREIVHGSLAARLSRLAAGIDVHIVADGGDTPTAPTIIRRATGDTPPWRQRAAWLLFATGVPLATVLLTTVRDELELSSVLLLYMVLVTGIAVLGGRIAALASAVTSALAANFFFVEPRFTLNVADVDDVVSLVVFVAVATVIGVLVDRVATAAANSHRARAEAELLARGAAVIAGDPNPAESLLRIVADTMRMSGAALSETSGGCERDLAVVGHADGTCPRIDLRPSPDGSTRALRVCGRALTADDRRILLAIGDQLVVALDGQSARIEARRSQELAAIDHARTALLRAVSHDLRTPLATIKAMASGLLDDSVRWQPEHIREAHVVIDQEADRLNQLIGNLLDASRLETGALAVTLSPTHVADAVAGALRTLSGPVDAIEVRIADEVPAVLADRSLLERAIANLIDNARRHSPAGAPVTVTAEPIGDHVHLCVADRGPGIPLERRDDVRAPFQRLDDRSVDGVGLGLSIVDGFVRAMGGSMILDDTPGGGLTVTLTLTPAPAEEATT